MAHTGAAKDVLVVTGAGGIGLAIAHRLANAMLCKCGRERDGLYNGAGSRIMGGAGMNSKCAKPVDGFGGLWRSRHRLTVAGCHDGCVD